MRIVKHIPNTITCLNLLSGVMGIIVLFGGRPDQAFFLMLAAAVFDFCDGLAARALGAYSELGKELDSLADMVSFGVLPAMMLFVGRRSSWWLSLPCVWPNSTWTNASMPVSWGCPHRLPP